MTSASADNKLPLISVLMPVYNAAPYLQESIDSILSQTYTRFELLILNDGSSDDSVAISQAAAKLDSRIRFFDSANQGLVYQLNKGLQEAGGQYIARMDADDVAYPERFAHQIAYLESHPEVGLCGTAVRYIGASEGIIHLPETDAEIQNILWLQNAFYHPTVVIRTQVLTEYSLRYNPAYECAEDYKLWSELSAVTSIYNLPEVLLDYRIHANQISRQQSIKQQKCVAIIRREQMSRLRIQLNPSQERAFELLTLEDSWGEFSMADYKAVATLLNDLCYQAQKKVQAPAIVYRTASEQWKRILGAARHYRPALIPYIIWQPFQRYLPKVEIAKLLAKCLVGWRVRPAA